MKSQMPLIAAVLFILGLDVAVLGCWAASMGQSALFILYVFGVANTLLLLAGLVWYMVKAIMALRCGSGSDCITLSSYLSNRKLVMVGLGVLLLVAINVVGALLLTYWGSWDRLFLVAALPVLNILAVIAFCLVALVKMLDNQ